MAFFSLLPPKLLIHGTNVSPKNPGNLQHPNPENLHPISHWPSHCKIDHKIRHDTNKRENKKETIKYRY